MIGQDDSQEGEAAFEDAFEHKTESQESTGIHQEALDALTEMERIGHEETKVGTSSWED